MAKAIRLCLVPLFCVFLTACPLDNGSPPPSTTVAQVIPASGGTIDSSDDRLTLTFPDGALATATEISIKALSPAEMANKYPGVSDDFDFVYELSPDGTAFTQPVQVSFLLPDDDTLDIPRTLLTVSNGVAQALENVVYDAASGTITGTLSHFSDLIASNLGFEIDYPKSMNATVSSVGYTFVYTLDDINTQTTFEGTVATLTVEPPTTASGNSNVLGGLQHAVGAVWSTLPSNLEGNQLTGSAVFACVGQGTDTLRVRFVYADTVHPMMSFGTVTGIVAEGTFDIEVDITCTDTGLSNGSPPEEETVETLSSSIFSAGQGPEAIKNAGAPPYLIPPNTTVPPSTTLQRYIVSGLDTVKVVDSNGDEIYSDTLFSGTYGALYLQHSTAGDFYFSIGSSGKNLCLLPDGFCQIDSLAVANPNSTSIEYGVDANGNPVYNQAFRVRGGALLHTVESGSGWQETEVFNGSSTPQLPNSESLFAYEPLSPGKGIGITAAGKVYFIDLDAGTATEIASAIGSDLRDVSCDAIGGGIFGCAVQSFGDATITPCFGSSASDFSCGTAVAAGDGVSLGAAKTNAGTLAVVGADYTDASVHLLEFSHSGGLIELSLQAEWFPSQYLSLFGEVGLRLDFLGHAEMDADNNAIILSGNGSSAAGVISLGEAGTAGLPGASGFTFWFN